MDMQKEIIERLALLEEQVQALQEKIDGAGDSLSDKPVARATNVASDSTSRVFSTTYNPGTKTTGLPDLSPPPPPSPAPGPPPSSRIRTPAPRSSSLDSSPRFQPPGASFWMAGGAGLAFVLAAIYFVKLVYDFGWLTPERQIVGAIIAAVALILGGLALARHDRSYAAYLPATGIIILYIAIYCAHIFYGMISTGVVIFGVGTTTVASMWLERYFNNTAYAIFAVIGAYAFPLLIQSGTESIVDEIIYFGAFSLLFSFISLQERKRVVYTLAMFFSIIGFDIAWRMSVDADAWMVAATYQFVQFLVFAGTATYYSIRFREPVDRVNAFWHGIALFYFYIAEFLIFKQNVPSLAPYVALVSVVIVTLAYVLAARALKNPAMIKSGATLISVYGAVVTAHVFFIELIPVEYLPWAALLAPLTAVAIRPRFANQPEAFIPIACVAVFISFAGLSMLLDDAGQRASVFMPNIALFIYAAFLYTASRVALVKGPGNVAAVPLLYGGHISFMVATVKSFESGLAISMIWGIFAVILLIVALKMQNRSLGQSSLLVFAASGLKVLLYDLTGTPSLVRVLTLVVLGATLYAGGWIYQRIAADANDENVAANAQAES